MRYQVMTDKYSGVPAGSNLDVTIGDKVYTLEIAGNISYDCRSTAEKIILYGRSGDFSTRTVSAPRRAALQAAATPAEPPPITATSHTDANASAARRSNTGKNKTIRISVISTCRFQHRRHGAPPALRTRSRRNGIFRRGIFQAYRQQP